MADEASAAAEQPRRTEPSLGGSELFRLPWKGTAAGVSIAQTPLQ